MDSNIVTKNKKNEMEQKRKGRINCWLSNRNT